jgi:predicted MPP superfamily phosphohydrolase
MKLELGYDHPFEIRKYGCLAEGASGTRILYLSDFHYNRFGQRLVENVCSAIGDINPEIVLLGGDYADSKKGVYYFKRMMESITWGRKVFAIAGNHDRRRIRQIKTIVEGCNGVWLEKKSAIVDLGNFTIRIDGGLPATRSSGADFSILCLHRPIDTEGIAHRYQVIFAGHLHAGQMVLWQRANGLYPGRLIYKWNRLAARFGGCQYLISKGLGDTLPIRYNCRKDVILVELGSGLNPAYNKT